MELKEALGLCESGHAVRPVCWHKVTPLNWIESRRMGTEVVFVECGVYREIGVRLHLQFKDEFMGEWEVVDPAEMRLKAFGDA